MDYRIGEMKKVKKKVEITLKKLTNNTPILILLYIIFGTWILRPLSPSLRDSVLITVFSGFLGLLFGIYLEEIKSRRKIRELKPAILLELRCIFISLMENFTRFYVAYFAVLKLFKSDLINLKWFYELTEKYGKYFTDYLMNEIKICMYFYENFGTLKQEDIEEIIRLAEQSINETLLRSKYPTMEDVERYFEKEKSRYRENKPSIKPIHMALLSSILNNLSALDKDFAENIFYIWCEINELNKEIEVLKESLQMDPKLILSILKRTERIAIKIDEILEKEGTDL
jgi:hypothetical protein